MGMGKVKLKSNSNGISKRVKLASMGILLGISSLSILGDIGEPICLGTENAGISKVYASTKVDYKVASTTLNMRAKSDINAKVVKVLKKNQVVTATTNKVVHGWIQVKVGKTTGWVSSIYLTKEKATKSPTKKTTKKSPTKVTKVANDYKGVKVSGYSYYVNEATGLTIRDTYSTSGKKLGSLSDGSKVVVLEKTDNGWLKVKKCGIIGWINGAVNYGVLTKTSVTYTIKNPSSVQKYVHILDTMNVRDLPNVKGKALGSLKGGKVVKVLKISSSNWAEIQYSTKQKGWVSLATKDTKLSSKPKGITQVSDTVQTTKKDGSLKGIKLVVDAGHGGGDAGAVGKDLNGVTVTEKDLNLKASKAIKAEVEENGGTVYMTREFDSRISENRVGDLSARAKYAKNKGANAFISVHHNSATASTASGYETLYYSSSSQSFAQSIHDAVRDSIKDEYGSVTDRKNKYQNVMVLRENTVYATLIELGFISNPSEVSKVNTDRYRGAVAEGVVEGLKEFYKR